MSFRRRTRRLRHWYRRHDHSTGMLVARVLLIAIAAVIVAVIVVQAISSQQVTPVS